MTTAPSTALVSIFSAYGPWLPGWASDALYIYPSIDGADWANTYSRIEIQLTGYSTFIIDHNNEGPYIEGKSIRYENLEPGEYKLSVRVYYTVNGVDLEPVNKNGDVVRLERTFVVVAEEEPDNRPDDWAWTTAERTAFNGNGNTTTLTQDRWNEFIERVRDFLKYKEIDGTAIGVNPYGESVNTTYSDFLSLAKGVATDKTMYAGRFNIARYCIGSMLPAGETTGIKDKKPGDPVLGKDFITLESKIKDI
jgi:hypothetical protein